MNKINQTNGLNHQIWSFIRNEGLPCLFVILMLCNGLFFAYAVFDQNNTNSYKVNIPHTSESVDLKPGYIN
ncbi:hypothetical protein F2A31_01805 [Acinetobacter suaedae]|uniref:Uncharacterized protein n=1 Tax=Acinetobacter suaedae TaxID=2609668 RepID=A0A5P1UP49_9GAMM|nr:hypothetical protein F2A31_01805 [Acinetobacter sp. C16S1]